QALHIARANSLVVGAIDLVQILGRRAQRAFFLGCCVISMRPSSSISVVGACCPVSIDVCHRGIALSPAHTSAVFNNKAHGDVTPRWKVMKPWSARVTAPAEFTSSRSYTNSIVRP